MKKIAWVLLAMVAMVGCTDNFKRDNPYDPEAPAGIQAPASICGYVVSSRDAQPLDGAEVRIVELGLSSTTQADGQFRFDSLAAGNWTLEVSVPEGLDSYLSSIRRIALEPGTTYECPPSGQEVPEVQTIVLRRRPDAPRIIDLSADDDGLILTFAAEAGLDFDRFDLRFESVFIGGGNPVTLEFSSEDVDVKDDVSQVYLATLRPFQNGTPPGLSATDTYNLSVRAFDSGLASTFSETVRYAHRLEFTRCAYNQPDTVNNELCAPLDGSLPEALDAQPTEIDVVGDDYILVEHDDCTVAVWETAGAYLGCMSFAWKPDESDNAICNIVTGQDNILALQGSFLSWQVVPDASEERLLALQGNIDRQEFEQLEDLDECIDMFSQGETYLSEKFPMVRELVVSEDQGDWILLMRTNESVYLYRNGSLVWRKPLNQEGLSSRLRLHAYKWVHLAGDVMFLNSSSSSAKSEISLIELSTGTELDRIELGQAIVDLEFITPTLFVVVQKNGDVLFFDYDETEVNKAFKEVGIFPSSRTLNAETAIWLKSQTSSNSSGKGVLAVLDQGNGIVNLRAVGYRSIADSGVGQWLLEVENRGDGTDAFQGALLRTLTAEMVSLEDSNGEHRILMRSESDSLNDSRISSYEFSP